ncbi:MAG TPA: NUDIX hydrolase [Patescibacteria group bacterium]|nr:NUDIX hydrolase [Patescibacteria group bacterium]
MKSPKKITKQVFSAKLFHVDEVQLTYSDGDNVTHHVAIRKPTVSVFPLTDQYELYLVSQYRYLLEKQSLEAMAGFINEHETPLHAAKRELQEETGIRAEQFEFLRSIDISASVFLAKNYLFLAKGLTLGEPHPDLHESIEVVKVPLDVAVQKVMDGEITASSSIIGILLLDRLRKEKKL